jgi:hypothetical protein
MAQGGLIWLWTGGAAGPVIPSLPPGGYKTKGKVRRIRLSNGRIVSPRNQQEYRRIVAEILAEELPQVIEKKTKKSTRQPNTELAALKSSDSPPVLSLLASEISIPPGVWQTIRRLTDEAEILRAQTLISTLQAIYVSEEDDEIFLLALTLAV